MTYPERPRSLLAQQTDALDAAETVRRGRRRVRDELSSDSDDDDVSGDGDGDAEHERQAAMAHQVPPQAPAPLVLPFLSFSSLFRVLTADAGAGWTRGGPRPRQY